MAITEIKNIAKDFVVLSPELRASVEEADADLYQRIAQNYQGFAGHQLVAVHDFDSDWQTWEVHPHGDELVVLLEGAASLVLKQADGEQKHELCCSGDFAIVPKGVWHTAEIRSKARLLFVTPGQETENCASPQ